MKAFAVGTFLGLVFGATLLTGRQRTLVLQDQTARCERQILLLQRQVEDVQESLAAKLFSWLLPKAPNFTVSSGDSQAEGFVDFIPVAGQLWRAFEAQQRCEQRLQKAQQEVDLFLTKLEALRFHETSFLKTGAGEVYCKIVKFCCLALLICFGWGLLGSGKWLLELGMSITGAANAVENGAILEPDDAGSSSHGERTRVEKTDVGKRICTDGAHKPKGRKEEIQEEKDDVPRKQQKEEGGRLCSDDAPIQKPLREVRETDGVTEEEENSATSSDSSQTSEALAGNRFRPLAKLGDESNELWLLAKEATKHEEAKAKKQKETRRLVKGKKQPEAELEPVDARHVEQWANVSGAVWSNLLYFKKRILSTYGVTLWNWENGKMLLKGTKADINRFIQHGMEEFMTYERAFMEDVPGDCFGRIIGRGGANLARFEEEYGVHVQMRTEGRGAAVMLIGSKEGIAAVEARIMEIVEDWAKSDEEKAAGSLHVKHLKIANEYFGRIIGRQGANINHILEDKNAEVKFDDCANVVTVNASSLEELEEIENEIAKAVQLGELKKQPWHKFQLSLPDRVSVIKNNDLRELQDSLGVKIWFPRSGDPWEVVSIQGERAKAKEVYQKLTSCLMEGKSDLTKDTNTTDLE